MTIGAFAFWNGAIRPLTEVCISPFDRGFLFAHAAYEVTAIYAGRQIDADGHAARLARTLAGIAIPPLPFDPVAAQAELIACNGVREGLVYLHVTAGDYGARDFAGPAAGDMRPNAFAFTVEKPLITEAAREGISVISRPDERWARRDLKTTQLLSQALAYRGAKEAHTDSAWMHQDGLVTEAASANAWIVTPQGRLRTHPLSTDILAGITRTHVIRHAHAIGLPVEETAFALEDVRAATEAFTSSAGALILPVARLDGHPVGDGRPGPVTRALQRAYYTHMGMAPEDLPAWCV